jgi:hypothetical protein
MAQLVPQVIKVPQAQLAPPVRRDLKVTEEIMVRPVPQETEAKQEQLGPRVRRDLKVTEEIMAQLAQLVQRAIVVRQEPQVLQARQEQRVVVSCFTSVPQA